MAKSKKAGTKKRQDEGRESDFYRGKVLQATYYAGVTLPLTLARLDTCLRQGREVLDMPQEAF